VFAIATNNQYIELYVHKEQVHVTLGPLCIPHKYSHHLVLVGKVLKGFPVLAQMEFLPHHWSRYESLAIYSFLRPLE